jgi:Mevalonate kinase
LISKASAPGKIILFGEHFVVHGVKAILGAINKRVTVISKKNDTQNIFIKSSLGKDSIAISESLDNIDNMFKPFFFIAKKIISENNFENGIDLEIQSEIPIGAGKGSSSACCVAAAASVSPFFSNPAKKHVLVLAIAAGDPKMAKTSGAD